MDLFESIYELAQLLSLAEKITKRPACQLHMITEQQLNTILKGITPKFNEVKEKFSSTPEWNFKHGLWFGDQFMQQLEEIIQEQSFKKKKEKFLKLSSIGDMIMFFHHDYKRIFGL